MTFVAPQGKEKADNPVRRDDLVVEVVEEGIEAETETITEEVLVPVDPEEPTPGTPHNNYNPNGEYYAHRFMRKDFGSQSTSDDGFPLAGERSRLHMDDGQQVMAAVASGTTVTVHYWSSGTVGSFVAYTGTAPHSPQVIHYSSGWVVAWIDQDIAYINSDSFGTVPLGASSGDTWARAAISARDLYWGESDRPLVITQRGTELWYSFNYADLALAVNENVGAGAKPVIAAGWSDGEPSAHIAWRNGGQVWYASGCQHGWNPPKVVTPYANTVDQEMSIAVTGSGVVFIAAAQSGTRTSCTWSADDGDTWKPLITPLESNQAGSRIENLTLGGAWPKVLRFAPDNWDGNRIIAYVPFSSDCNPPLWWEFVNNSTGLNYTISLPWPYYPKLFTDREFAVNFRYDAEIYQGNLDLTDGILRKAARVDEIYPVP